MPEQETPLEFDIAPPPLFSPHIYIPDKHERRTYEEGYTIEFAPFMVSDYDALYPVLVQAKKYKLPVTWKRTLEVIIHEAWALKPQVGFTIHDVRCKVAVGEQTGRTELENPNAEHKIIWNTTFKFQVGNPCDIIVLLYCNNTIFPNDKLGRIWITPDQIVENKTITEWFKMNTDGEVKLSITLSPPALSPFKFSFSSRLSVSSHDSHIFDANDKKIFTLIGKWPYSISLLDSRGMSVLTLKNCVNEPREREYALYEYGQTTPTLSLTQTYSIDESQFKIEGLPSVATVRTAQHSFNFISPSKVRVASAKLEEQKYFVEIHPGEDALKILATMVLIAKLLFVEGQAIKEWTSLRNSGNWQPPRLRASMGEGSGTGGSWGRYDAKMRPRTMSQGVGGSWGRYVEKQRTETH